MTDTADLALKAVMTFAGMTFTFLCIIDIRTFLRVQSLNQTLHGDPNSKEPNGLVRDIEVVKGHLDILRKTDDRYAALERMLTGEKGVLTAIEALQLAHRRVADLVQAYSSQVTILQTTLASMTATLATLETRKQAMAGRHAERKSTRKSQRKTA